jgi:F0F1-type ATP synthase assembly protein I
MRGPSKVPDGNSSPSFMDLLSMGVASAVALGVGLVAGILLDGWLRTGPVFTFLGLALGIVAAIVLTVRQVRRSL